MEGTVTIKVEDYNEFKKYEDFYYSERTVIYRNDCIGKLYFSKAEPNDLIQELKTELQEEKDYSYGIRQKLEKLEEENKRLKDTCNSWKEMWDKNKNKSFFKRLFS